MTNGTSPTPAPSQPTSSSPLWDLVVKALGVIAGGVTITALVAVVGGAVTWSRFQSVGLPATQAVALVDRTELIATGLVALIPFTIFAVVAIGLTYMIDPEANVASGAAPSAVASRQLALDVSVTVAESGEQYALAERLELPRAGDPTPEPPVAHPRERKPKVIKATVLARHFWRGVKDTWVRALIFLALGVGAFFLRVGGDAPTELILWAVGAVLVATLLSWGVAAQTTGFRWFAVAAFLSISIAGGLIEFVRTQESPKVQPGAVLLIDGRAVSGFYVAQSSSRIYLGRVTPRYAGAQPPAQQANTKLNGGRVYRCLTTAELGARKSKRGPKNPIEIKPVHSSGRIFSFERAKVVAVSSGSLQSMCAALVTGPRLATELQSQQGVQSANAGTTTTKK